MYASPKEDCATEARKEWVYATPALKCSLVDPEGDKDLLVQFLNWVQTQPMTHDDYIAYGVVTTFLNERFRAGWVETRTEELEELRRPDYDC